MFLQGGRAITENLEGGALPSRRPAYPSDYEYNNSLQVAYQFGGQIRFGIVLVNEKDLEMVNRPPLHGHLADANLCSWWRRRRGELPCEHDIPVLLAA